LCTYLAPVSSTCQRQSIHKKEKGFSHDDRQSRGKFLWKTIALCPCQQSAIIKKPSPRLLLIPKLEIIGIADVLKFGSRGLSGSARS
jgi:hypothetical protein